MTRLVDPAQRAEEHDKGVKASGPSASAAEKPSGNRRLRVPSGFAAKLEVGAADDAYEREADAMARHVVEAIRAESTGAGPLATATGPAGRIRRKTAPECGPGYEPGTLGHLGKIRRRATIGAVGGTLDSDTESMLSTRVGRGRALDPGVRRLMEPAFGADFSGVRIHDDATSTDLNRRIEASAFTVGRDVFFNGPAPDVSTPVGQELLAHELTHVVQQGNVSRKVIKRFSPDARDPKSDPPTPPPVVGDEVEDDVDGDVDALARSIQRMRQRQRRPRPPSKKAKDVATVIKDVATSAMDVLGLTPKSPVGPGMAPAQPAPATAVKKQTGKNTKKTATGCYGAVDTEYINVKISAQRSGNMWYPVIKGFSGTYGKIVSPLPAGLKKVTGPKKNETKQQIIDLLNLDGADWYMISAVDAHETIHENHIGPALDTVAAQLQGLFAGFSVPYSDTVKSQAAALKAMKALPGYTALTNPGDPNASQIRAIWDAQYVININRDHYGPTQLAEADVVEPMIDRINAYRVKKNLLPIPKVWTCTDGDDNVMVPPGRTNP